uniref:Uncharacterized protein n=1 Tax=Zea mays TaxID=4577 RepID=A0A804MB62_MAIZE
MQAARGRAQERVQHVLPRLHERRALLPVPRLPPRPPRHPDTEVLLPRRDPGVGDPEGAGHQRRADLHHQQRARGVPERAAAAEARQGRHQHLRGLRAQPPRHLPLLLPRLQGIHAARRQPNPKRALHCAVTIPHVWLDVCAAQIVRTSGDFRIRKKHAIVAKKKREKKHAPQQKQHRGAADSADDDDDDSSTSTSGGSDKSSVVQSFTPSTPPATTANSFRAGKRRKGVPHRSPFGSLVVEF